MVRKLVVATLVCCFVALAGATAATAAPAQASPPCGDGSTYPPQDPTVDIDESITLVSASLQPGRLGNLVFAGAEPGVVYSGTLYSTPVALPPTSAEADGSLTFSFAVPSDFELGADHHVDLCDGAVLAAAFDFCVSITGAIASSCVEPGTTPDPGGSLARGGTGGGTGGGSLARTGTDLILPLLRLALLLCAVGTAFEFTRRRRTAA